MRLHISALPFVFATLSAQSPISVTAPVTSVRLHPDEAWITRVQKVPIEKAGNHRVEILSLPAGLTLEDLRVTARGPQGTRIADITLAPDVQYPSMTRTFKNLSDDEAKASKSDLEARRESLKDEIAYLRKTLDTQAGLPSQTLQTQQLLDFGKSIQARLGELLNQDRKLAFELEQLAGLPAKKQEFERWRECLKKQTSKVQIELEVPKSGTVEITLQNRTLDATWKPSYEARLSDDLKRVEVVLLANVSQRTLEAWNQVPIELSTMRQKRAPAPRPGSPAQISWVPPEPTSTQGDSQTRMWSASMACGSGTMADAAPMMKDAAAPQAPSAPLFPALESNASISFDGQGLGTSFLLEGLKTVPSDAQPHRFRVLSREADLKLAYTCTPRLASEVHQIARFQMPMDLPLFKGALFTPFIKGQRLPASALESPRPGQSTEFPLGVHERLSAHFERLDAISPYRLTQTKWRKTQKSGVTQTEREEQIFTTGKERVWTLDELFTLGNSTQEPVEIEVMDREIKSTHERVKVQFESKPVMESALPNLRRWIVKVGPGSASRIQQSTVISGPKAGTLSGLAEVGFTPED